MKIIQSLNEVKFFKDHMRRGCFGFWLVMTTHSPLNCFIQEGQVFWYTPIFSAKSWKYSLCIILHCMMCIISHRQKETKSPHFTPGGCIRNFRSSNGEILFRLKKKKKSNCMFVFLSHRLLRASDDLPVLLPELQQWGGSPSSEPSIPSLPTGQTGSK